jgi:hypothetical protein
VPWPIPRVSKRAWCDAYTPDVPQLPAELARYCTGAATAARGLPSKAAVRRLAQVTLTGLRPPAPGA